MDKQDKYVVNLSEEHYKQGDTVEMFKAKIYPLLYTKFRQADDTHLNTTFKQDDANLNGIITAAYRICRRIERLELVMTDIFNLTKEHYIKGDTFVTLKTNIYPLLNPVFQQQEDETTYNDFIILAYEHQLRMERLVRQHEVRTRTW